MGNKKNNFKKLNNLSLDKNYINDFKDLRDESKSEYKDKEKDILKKNWGYCLKRDITEIWQGKIFSNVIVDVVTTAPGYGKGKDTIKSCLVLKVSPSFQMLKEARYLFQWHRFLSRGQ